MRPRFGRQLSLGALALAASVTLTPAAHATAQAPRQRSCGATLANRLSRTGAARQLITVQVASAAATTAIVELWQRTGPSASCFSRVGGPFPANVGANGTSTNHREGDDTTPVGLFGFAPELYGIDPNPGVHYHYHQLVCGDWWDEEPASPMYNRFVHTGCGTQPSFGPRSEALWRTAPFYDWMAVIDYNSSPIVPGKGSGIFLHVTVGRATAGCVALPAPDLLRTLRWLTPSAKPLIAIGTSAELAAL